MASSSEVALAYAALILHDDEVEVTSDKLEAILKASKVSYEPFWIDIFVKALAGKNIGDLIMNIGSGAAAAPAAGGAAPAAGGDDAAAAAPAPEPEESESEEEMGFGLFD